MNFHLPLSNRSDHFLEVVNLQTLFGKDYYVIMRPSLIFDFEYNNQIWIKIIVPIIIIIIIIGCIMTIIIIKKEEIKIGIRRVKVCCQLDWLIKYSILF